MITYKMYGIFAKADLASDDSVEAPRVCVSVNPLFVDDEDYFLRRCNDGWWKVFFAHKPDVDEVKAALGALNNVVQSEIEIVPQTTRT